MNTLLAEVTQLSDVIQDKAEITQAAAPAQQAKRLTLSDYLVDESAGIGGFEGLEPRMMARRFKLSVSLDLLPGAGFSHGDMLTVIADVTGHADGRTAEDYTQTLQRAFLIEEGVVAAAIDLKSMPVFSGEGIMGITLD